MILSNYHIAVYDLSIACDVLITTIQYINAGYELLAVLLIHLNDISC